jgi:hypothetical protein
MSKLLDWYWKLLMSKYINENTVWWGLVSKICPIFSFYTTNFIRGFNQLLHRIHIHYLVRFNNYSSIIRTIMPYFVLQDTKIPCYIMCIGLPLMSEILVFRKMLSAAIRNVSQSASPFIFALSLDNFVQLQTYFFVLFI